MAANSTRQKLLCLIDDIEIVSKELFETMSTPKNQLRPDGADTVMLMELLVEKDKEIKSTLKIAEEQAEIQTVMDSLKTQVDKRDIEIKILQKNLKESETILSTAVYQAQQKLESINQANTKKISSEELIKFAHRISASNAVAAPVTWAPGDPRRPYPTDLDMRQGFLGQGTYTDTLAVSRSNSQISNVSETNSTPVSSNSLSWQHPPEVSITSSISHHAISDFKGHNKENEEIELMSSDSSSSSSSDE
ncbi:mediator of RNA polymerase II transcription subunit 4 [Patella vulgata]|uniref:Mediator of RNA polymerase II transcription subunit 4 n=1 Tax=Patella caerulea TaxID=87958 RepID=A0AAN8J493_PATCE|nr:mediator of RNA polymerase II transcription subunit 4 [Patella vulgata]